MKELFPIPSLAETIQLENGEFLLMIEFDRLAYKKRTNTKTLSIPQWLQVLQEALIHKLQLI